MLRQQLALRTVDSLRTQSSHATIQTQLNLFKGIFDKQATIFEQTVATKLSTLDDRISRSADKVDRYGVFSREKSFQDELEIGDMYRELKLTHGKLLSAFGKKNRELALAQNELRRIKGKEVRVAGKGGRAMGAVASVAASRRRGGFSSSSQHSCVPI